MNIAISFFRLLAILLIVKEHLETLYPKSSLAIGGHLGNSIFFFVSGWGLAESFTKTQPGVAQWYKKRFLKLLLMLSVIIFFIHFPELEKILSTLYFHIIPYPLSKSVYFIPNLVVIYAFSYPLLSCSSSFLKKILFILASMPIAVYFLVPEKSDIYNFTYPMSAFFCFISGISVKKEYFLVTNKFFTKFKFVIPLLICTIILHAVLRKMPYREISNIYICFLEVFILYILIKNTIKKFDFSKYQKFIFDIASASLAVYLVHFSVINFYSSAGLVGYGYVAKTYLVSFALASALTAVALKTVELMKRVAPNSTVSPLPNSMNKDRSRQMANPKIE